jgi:hypothetical protein
MTAENLDLLQLAFHAVKLTEGNALIFSLGVGSKINPTRFLIGIKQRSYGQSDGAHKNFTGHDKLELFNENAL